MATARGHYREDVHYGRRVEIEQTMSVTLAAKVTSIPVKMKFFLSFYLRQITELPLGQVRV
jgi:hypothetical protein